MPASVNCPTCKSAVAVATDADGRRSAWCETCQRRIVVTKKSNPAPTAATPPVKGAPVARSTKRRPADDRDDEDAAQVHISNNLLMYVAGGAAAFALLLVMFIGAYFLLKKDAAVPNVAQKDDPVIGMTTTTAGQPSIGSPPVMAFDDVWHRKVGTPLTGDARFIGENPTRASLNGNFNPKTKGAEPEWVAMPDNVSQAGFSVKLPAGTSFPARSEVDPSTNQRFTFYQGTANDCGYHVELLKLPEGVQVSAQDLNDGAYRASIFSASYGLTSIAGTPAFSGSRVKEDVQYCAYVQKGSTLFLFVVVSLDRGGLNPDISRFIRSIELSGQATTQVAQATPELPPQSTPKVVPKAEPKSEGNPSMLDPTPTEPVKPKETPEPETKDATPSQQGSPYPGFPRGPFGGPPPGFGRNPFGQQTPFAQFTSAVVLPDKLITLTSPKFFMSGNFQRPVGNDPFRNAPDAGIPGSKHVVAQLIQDADPKTAKQIPFGYLVHDLQWSEKGGLTSIECSQGMSFKRPWTFYLHQHDANDFTKSKRTEIPDNTYFAEGSRYERLPHYEPTTEMFYIVSTIWESDLHKGMNSSGSTNVLRQAHMKDGEHTVPLEFKGRIGQYKTSPSGKWLLIEVDENQSVNSMSDWRGTIQPNSEKKRYLAICDAKTFKVVEKVPLPNVLQQLSILFRDDDTALAIMLGAGDTDKTIEKIVMQTITSIGKVEKLNIGEIPDKFSSQSSSVSFRGLILPDGKNLIVGPVDNYGQCLRFEINDGKIAYVESSGPGSHDTFMRSTFEVMPDGKQLLFSDGNNVKLYEFFEKMPK